ncbi:MAG: hypothetical protein IT491_08575 [Gammaproteobacteria bacterium]|nr:hypothetical protein [Gammaproteobacteria bacterium]
MKTVTKAILMADLAGRVVTEGQLARLLEGTPQRRYNLVNRALHCGELLRLRRGRYLLAPGDSRPLPHVFTIAQALRPGSYLSFETALSFHGWIPEATPATLSVTPGRRGQTVTVPTLGIFRFFPLALQRGYFLEGVDRQVLVGQSALVAQPLRALLDLFCLRKSPWLGVAALTQGLRIDMDTLADIDPETLARLRPVYRCQRMHALIDAMQRTLAS